MVRDGKPSLSASPAGVLVHYAKAKKSAWVLNNLDGVRVQAGKGDLVARPTPDGFLLKTCKGGTPTTSLLGADGSTTPVPVDPKSTYFETGDVDLWWTCGDKDFLYRPADKTVHRKHPGLTNTWLAVDGSVWRMSAWTADRSGDGGRHWARIPLAADAGKGTSDNTLALTAFSDGRLLLAMGKDDLEAGARWWLLDPDFTNRKPLTATVYSGPSSFSAYGNRLYLVPSTESTTPLWYSEDAGRNGRASSAEAPAARGVARSQPRRRRPLFSRSPPSAGAWVSTGVSWRW